MTKNLIETHSHSKGPNWVRKPNHPLSPIVCLASATPHRGNRHCIYLQVVCDAELKFVDVVANWQRPRRSGFASFGFVRSFREQPQTCHWFPVGRQRIHATRLASDTTHESTHATWDGIQLPSEFCANDCREVDRRRQEEVAMPATSTCRPSQGMRNNHGLPDAAQPRPLVRITSCRIRRWRRRRGRLQRWRRLGGQRRRCSSASTGWRRSTEREDTHCCWQGSAKTSHEHVLLKV